MAQEIERKFTAPDDWSAQSLGAELTLGEPTSILLDAVYFDTPHFALANNKMTLRRRTGGHDEGWHLKLPGDLDSAQPIREEIQEPIEPGQSRLVVPESLRARVTDVVGREPLIPVVNLQTRRVETPILNDEGTELALLADDEVTAIRGSETKSWREIEAEITGGEAADLDRIADALIESGAKPNNSPSKLAQALGDAPAAKNGTLPSPNTAGGVLMAYIVEQIGAIQGRLPEVRVDAPDAVHKMRVATRRLRSTLRTFRDLLDADRTEPLRAEIKWLGEMLGAPRDAEVMKERLLGALKNLPHDAIVGPVEVRLTHELDRTHKNAHARLVRALDSERCQKLFDDLVLLLTEPPLTDAATKSAAKMLGRDLKKSRRRVSKRWHKSEDSSGSERMRWSHEARKKAKAARYGWEAATPAFAKGEKAATAWEEVTEELGGVQDGLVAGDRLLELADAARAAGEPDFTYGVLWEREHAHQRADYEAGGDAIDIALKTAKRAQRKN